LNDQPQTPAPESHDSIVLPIVLSVLLSALVFGGLAFYLGLTQNGNQKTPTVQPTTVATATTRASTPAAELSPGEIANWKTYSNNKYNYSVKYPTDWKLNTTQLDAVNILEPKEVSDDDVLQVIGVINFEVFEGNTTTRKYAEWDVERYIKFVESGGKTEGEEFEPAGVQRYGSAKLDGIDGLKVNLHHGAADHYGVIVKRNDKFYFINLSARGGELDSNLKVYEKILDGVISTFKFTK
jgi:hypothetical protein